MDTPVFDTAAKSSVNASPPLVSVALEALGGAVDSLTNMVDRMEQKLSPAMGPDRPTPTSPSDQDSPEVSTIVYGITEKTDTINRLTRIAEGYLNRLEI